MPRTKTKRSEPDDHATFAEILGIRSDEDARRPAAPPGGGPSPSAGRRAKVERIRAEIRSGTYRVDPLAIADRMMPLLEKTLR